MTDNEKSSVAPTDAEIKKALEDYADRFHGIIKYVISQASAKEIHELLCGSLELINRQQAEIEMLQKLLDDKCDRCIAKERTETIEEITSNLYRVFAGHSDYHGDTILTKIKCVAEGKILHVAKPIDTDNIKTEAIQEFAERLKGFSHRMYPLFDEPIIDCKDIDNLVKEMVGDAE